LLPQLQDRVHFVINNLTEDNVAARANEIRHKVWLEAGAGQALWKLWPWHPHQFLWNQLPRDPPLRMLP